MKVLLYGTEIDPNTLPWINYSKAWDSDVSKWFGTLTVTEADIPTDVIEGAYEIQIYYYFNRLVNTLVYIKTLNVINPCALSAGNTLVIGELAQDVSYTIPLSDLPMEFVLPTVQD